jgi:hypothetical protein
MKKVYINIKNIKIFFAARVPRDMAKMKNIAEKSE